MELLLVLDGSPGNGTALVCHNERLADPLNEFSKQIAAISKKRGKTEGDHMELARLEFLAPPCRKGSLARPCRAEPCPAGPRHAPPSHANGKPCQAAPCPDTPCHEGSLDLPSRTMSGDAEGGASP